MLRRYAAGSRPESGARGMGISGMEALAAGEELNGREKVGGDLRPPLGGFPFDEVGLASCLLLLLFLKKPMTGAA